MISRAVPNRVDGAVSLYLARRLQAPDGRFLGIVSASIKLAYFGELFSGMGLAPGATVALRHRDGAFLVTSRPGALLSGIPPRPAWRAAVDAGGGSYHMPEDMTNGGGRIVSVHPVRGYPLVIDVSRADAQIYAQWRRQTMEIAAGVLAAVLGISIVMLALRRQVALMAAAQRRLADQANALQSSEARLQTTLEHMDQGIILVDADGTVTVHNRRARELLDLPKDLLAGQPSFAAVVEHQLQQGECPGDTQTRAMFLSGHAAYERRRPNGTVLEVRTNPLPGGGMVRTFTDITARAAAEEMLELAASHDELTQLVNRNGFNARLDAALTAAQRGGGRLALLCLDLDRFKVVNDTLGHEAGDLVLTEVAHRIRSAARDGDILARIGGDEGTVRLAPCGVRLGPVAGRHDA